MINLNNILHTNMALSPNPNLSSQPKNMDQNFIDTFQNHMKMMENGKQKDLNKTANVSNISKQSNKKTNDFIDTSQNTDKKTVENKEKDDPLEILEEENDIPNEMLSLLQNPQEVIEVLNKLQEEGYLEEDIVKDLVIQLETVEDFEGLNEGLKLQLEEIWDSLNKQNIDTDITNVVPQQREIVFQEKAEKLVVLPQNPQTPVEDKSVKEIKEDEIPKEDKGLKPQDKIDESSTIKSNDPKKETVTSEESTKKGFTVEYDARNAKPEIDREYNLEQELLITDLNNNITLKNIPSSIETINTEDLTTSNIIQQIVQQVDIKYKEGSNQIKLQLLPENLGKLSIDLISDNQEIRAKVYVESLMVKEVIEGNLNEFRESLTEKGINISNIEVSVGQDPETQQGNRGLQQNIRRTKKILNNDNYNSTQILEEIDNRVNINPYMPNTSFDKLG